MGADVSDDLIFQRGLGQWLVQHQLDGICVLQTVVQMQQHLQQQHPALLNGVEVVAKAQLEHVCQRVVTGQVASGAQQQIAVAGLGAVGAAEKRRDAQL